MLTETFNSLHQWFSKRYGAKCWLYSTSEFYLKNGFFKYQEGDVLMLGNTVATRAKKDPKSKSSVTKHYEIIARRKSDEGLDEYVLSHKANDGLTETTHDKTVIESVYSMVSAAAKVSPS